MGNCLSGLAFKKEGLEEEPKYELTRPNVSKIGENKNFL